MIVLIMIVRFGYIMNAIVNGNEIPNTFSTCSLNYVHNFLKDELKTCINNIPEIKWGDAICGNGYIESPNEQCDCGQDDCSLTNNPCCNGKTCQFLNSSIECNENELCCLNCQIIKDTNYKCRSSINDCDLAEYCNGYSSSCPNDLSIGSGTKCYDDTYGYGLCYSGFCFNHLRQCRTIGNRYNDGPYNQCPYNNHIQLNGYIKSNSFSSFTRGNNKNKGNNLQQQDYFCQTLWCQNNPNTCTYFTESSQITQVNDGIPCSIDGYNGKYQCLNSKCVLSTQLNLNYQFISSNWTNCIDCDQLQYRNISCIKINDNYSEIVDIAYCSANNIPDNYQLCQNKTLQCQHNLLNQINLFGYQLNKITIILTIISIISLAILILYICYVAVTYQSIEQDQELNEYFQMMK